MIRKTSPSYLIRLTNSAWSQSWQCLQTRRKSRRKFLTRSSKFEPDIDANAIILVSTKFLKLYNITTYLLTVNFFTLHWILCSFLMNVQTCHEKFSALIRWLLTLNLCKIMYSILTTNSSTTRIYSYTRCLCANKFSPWIKHSWSLYVIA